MTSDNGYIKIYRKMLNWEWISCEKTAQLFLILLLLANHKENRWHGIEIKPGQLVTSIDSLRKITGQTARSVRTGLERLKTTSEVTIKTTNRYTLITVENWALYQSDEDKTTSETTSNLTNKRQTNDKQTTTNKNDKNDKNIYPPIIPLLNSPELEKAVMSFVDFRKSMKAPMTDRAVELLVDKLKRMTGDIDIQIAILNQSILAGWKGIFPLKESIKPESKYKVIRE
jgi:hypothetical protein